MSATCIKCKLSTHCVDAGMIALQALTRGRTFELALSALELKAAHCRTYSPPTGRRKKSGPGQLSFDFMVDK